MNAGTASVLADLHMHSAHSWDCTTPIDELLDSALAAGLGALAVTDHNTIAGGVEARARAIERGLPLHVVVGSEIKTAEDGEVIGLFLHEEIPRGLAFAETLDRIKAQGALVYMPHPFDRFHATPSVSSAGVGSCLSRKMSPSGCPEPSTGWRVGASPRRAISSPSAFTSLIARAR